MAGSLPPPGRHGDDASRIATALGLDPTTVLDLATSLNPLAPDIKMLVATTLDSLRHYPDTTSATAAMAEVLGSDSAHVLLTNGGSEAIALVAAELGSGWVTEPEFSLYRCHLSQIEEGAGRWRSNPNNPTGLLAAPAEVAAVWDEAFYPLSAGRWTRGDASSGAVVIGSLTKLLACPGLRLGYVLSANDELIARLAVRQPQWSVSSPALAALPALLELVDLAGWQSGVAQLRRDLCSLLQRFDFEPDPSDANFVLVRSGNGLRERLAPLGIVVRDCESFGLPGAVRIAVPDAAGLERLEAALEEVSGKKSRPATGHRRVTANSGPLKGSLLVCGTSSDAGKSQLVTGLCRLLARRGISVAPFKAQNMSLNSFATPSGHEIGRAQGIQAIAAGIEPEAAMNPILLKPTGNSSSQVVVMGEPLGDLSSRSYLETRHEALLPVVLDAFRDLRTRYDVVICEGAGSPAEINLLEGDLVNLGLADAASIPALLLGDIERGGVFASIAGTFAVLPERLSRHLRAFAINKFRGDPSLLTDGLKTLVKMLGRPCAGVIPYLDGLHLDAEDSLGLRALIASSAPMSPERLDVAVIGLPRLSNFTDLDALSIEPQISLRMVTRGDELGDPDLVILPGSKETVRDLEWLRQRGIVEPLRSIAAAPNGATVLGICAGYQMLGQEIDDPYESGVGRVEAIGLQPSRTRFAATKVTRPRRGRSGCVPVVGYEIHQGTVSVTPGSGCSALLELEDEFGRGAEGCVTEGGRVVGTSLHGLFESDEFRAEFLTGVACRRKKKWQSSGASLPRRREEQIDRLADAIEEHLDLNLIFSLIDSAAQSPPENDDDPRPQSGP